MPATERLPMLRIQTVHIERVTITGPSDDIGQARDYFEKLGFQITGQAGYLSPQQETFFHLTGEREVQLYESMEQQVLCEIESASPPTHAF